MKQLICAALIALASFSAHATLIDRGGGMIYDSDQNITWLQDFSYALTTNPDAGTYQSQFLDANNWATNLTYGGFTDWRLPAAQIIDDYSFHPGETYADWSNRTLNYYIHQSFDGTTDRGYNNTNSELGHLFTELGNLAAFDEFGNPQVGAGLTNTGPFINMQATRYYDSNTFFYYSGESYVWTFNLANGYQTGASQYLEFPLAPMWTAVHDGDIGNPYPPVSVPEPASLALLMFGLVAIGAQRRRREVQ